MNTKTVAPNAESDQAARGAGRPARPWLQRSALAILILAVWLVAPLILDDAWVSVLCYAGITGIGALGLNLLTGYTGQISLGHSALIGVGAYAAGYFGQSLGLPVVAWLPLAGLSAAAVGAVVGPFALRLRGLYLAIVTLSLVYVGLYVFGVWGSLTGGPAGRVIDAPVSLGFVNVANLYVFGRAFSRNQGYFWLIWGILIVGAIVLSNIVNSRPGRAFQAVREREVAAQALGVEPRFYKFLSFVISSAYAGVAGGLFAVYQQYVTPSEFSITMAIQYVAIIVVGGMGSVWGTILGAVFIGSLPSLISQVAGAIPGLTGNGAGGGIITVASLDQIVYGVLIALFLLFEPRGLAAAVKKLRNIAARYVIPRSTTEGDRAHV